MIASTPLSFLYFAAKYPEEVAYDPAMNSTITWGNSGGILYRENRIVNESIKPRKDKEGFDTWSLFPEYGDCEDYVVSKRHNLIMLGLPVNALRFAICKLNHKENHMVLIAVCEEGRYVLNNLTNTIMRAHMTGLTFISWSTENPKIWEKWE